MTVAVRLRRQPGWRKQDALGGSQGVEAKSGKTERTLFGYDLARALLRFRRNVRPGSVSSRRANAPHGTMCNHRVMLLLRPKHPRPASFFGFSTRKDAVGGRGAEKHREPHAALREIHDDGHRRP